MGQAQALAQAEDDKLDRERRRAYLGTARVRLEALHFRREGLREPDQRHVDYLKGCFRDTGCRPLEKQNHISAVIGNDHLDGAIQASQLTRADLLSNQPQGYAELVLPPGLQVECLHGRHRILAASEVLNPADKWWVVDLYRTDLDPELEIWLTEEFVNEEGPTDGEIFRKIRRYHHQGRLGLKSKWEARLKGRRRVNLKGLLKHDGMTQAFDALLDIPGLWDGMMLTTLHKLMAMHMHEENIRYLTHIKQVWTDLVGGDEGTLGRIDRATVKALELRAPRASTLDADALRGLGAFSAFDDREREEIWVRLKKVDGLIPSLFTFFQDINYLRLCVDCVKWLVPTCNVHNTMHSLLAGALKNVRERECQIVVQVAEDRFRVVRGSRADRTDLAIRQLYAFAMRHYPAMPPKSQKENSVKKPRARADPAVLVKFADLANRLGFVTDEITTLRQHHIPSPPMREPQQRQAYLVTPGPGLPIGERCGPPLAEAYENDQDFLFIHHLHDEPEVQGEGITSFFVRQSVYFSFFGRPDAGSNRIINSIFSPEGQDHEPTGDRQDREQEQEQQRLVQENLRQERLAQERLAEENLRRERLAQERLETEKLERLEAERLEAERLEAERLEAERLIQEQERLVQERLAQENLRQARLAQERLAEENLRRERLAQERLEAEKLEAEKLEAEKLEAERLERLEAERLEAERLMQEQERLAQERLAQERLAQERLEAERLMKEQEKLVQEKLAQDRLEAELKEVKRLMQEQEKLAQEKLAQEKEKREQKQSRKREKERQEEERQRGVVRERDRRAQEETVLGLGGLKANSEERRRKRITQLDIESVISGNQGRFPSGQSPEGRRVATKATNTGQKSLGSDLKSAREPVIAGADLNIAQEPSTPEHPRRQNSASPAREAPRLISIRYYHVELGEWKHFRTLHVDPSDLSEIQNTAVEYMRDGFRLFTNTFDILGVRDCFQRATTDGSNIIRVIHETEINIIEHLSTSISEHQRSEEDLFKLDSSEDDIYNGIE